MPTTRRQTCMMIAVSLLGFALFGATAPLNKPPYHIKTKQGPDALTGGWFINLGITGARAKILEERPAEFEIAYVFPDTPASGVLEVGDRIVGANDKRFLTPHTFGYGVGKFGYQGPMMDFASALEESQTTGSLELLIIRNDDLQIVELDVGTRYGAYAETYPTDCTKTDRILDDILPYLAKRQKKDGTWHNRPHLNTFAALAMLGSGKERYMPYARKAARAFAEQTNDVIDYRGLDCWKYGLYGIYLAEYYLATKEEWVLDELREINRWLEQAQMANGGWGHRPANKPGGNGYGSICILTMQAKMAWALMKRCGIEIDPERFQAAHDFVVKGTGESGYVWYKDGGKQNPGYADMGRTGAAALAHGLSANTKGYSAYANRAATCIGTHPDTFSDTHGSPILGMVFTALGAAVDENSFRDLMNHNRWWFTLAHCPDGTFYYQLNRDNNPQDYTAAPRLSATAAAAVILLMRDKKLQMMRLASQ